jgi:hypothetical protein
MPIAVVSTSQGDNGLTQTPDTATVAAPTSITSGNLLVAQVTHDNGVTITPPSGWSLYQSISSSGGSALIKIYWKYATGSEPSTYVFTPSSSSSVLLVAILNLSGTDPTTPFNGYFSKYPTTASVTVGSTGGTPSIATILGCLPIAISVIPQLNPSNSGSPTGLTAGWTGEVLNVIEDTSNYFTTSNANGYDTTFIATGPLTSSTSTAVTASFTWGGGGSSFSTGVALMLFVNPSTAGYGTLGASPSTVNISGLGTSNAQQVSITETGYTGAFTVTVPVPSQGLISVATTQFGTYGTSCSISGPSSSFWIQEISAGNATVTVDGG